MNTHSLKTLPKYFSAVESGTKNFELRFNDRYFQVGDVLIIKEFHPDTGVTGREVRRHIIYILDEFIGLEEGWVILGFEPYEEFNLTMQRMRESIQSVAQKFNKATEGKIDPVVEDLVIQTYIELEAPVEKVNIELTINNKNLEAKGD